VSLDHQELLYDWLDSSGRQKSWSCTKVDVVVVEADLQVGQSKDTEQFRWNCQWMLLDGLVDLGEEVLESSVQLELHGGSGEESEAAGHNGDLININLINLEV